MRVIGDLTIDLYLTEEAALAEQVVAGTGRTTGATTLDPVLLPRLIEQLETARERFADNAAATDRLTRVRRDLADYLGPRRA